MTKKIIKEIKDFPGYFVDIYGTVSSAKGKELEALEPADNGSGYLGVLLYKGSKRYYRTIHRLVAEAFLPNPDNLPEVNHKDENKYNNSIENLEWISSRDNRRYSKCRPVIDLTTKAIYPSATDASEALNIDQSTVSSCIRQCNGKYKGHRFMYLPRATEESVNTIEFFSKKFEIPEIFDEYDFVKLFEII